MTKHIGILTSGGDCPGLNPMIRAVGKACRDTYSMKLIGFKDGFRGIALNRTIELEAKTLSNILTKGGTILGTARDKPHRINIGGKPVNMIDAIVENYQKNNLDALVCIGGGGTQKNALMLKEAGLNVVTLPKTIDLDIGGTDVTIGFNTAMEIVTDAIDRLHSTATSHNRIIVVEVMGHRAGWLALGAGIAGGADVILLPEIPYDINNIATAIKARTLAGKHFSIVAVSEGSMSKDSAIEITRLADLKKNATDKKEKKAAAEALQDFHDSHIDHTLKLTHELEKLTGLESRMTILGHLQRGGTPSALDRLWAARLGTGCAELLNSETYGVMLAVRNEKLVPVPLEETAGWKKLVDPNGPMVKAGRLVGTCFGD